MTGEPPRLRHQIQKDPVTALTTLTSPLPHPSSSSSFASSPSPPSAHLPHFLLTLPRRHCFSKDAALVALKACSRAHMPGKALRTFQNVPNIFRCKPIVRSYNALLDPFVRAHRWDQAESFLSYFYDNSSLSQ